LSTFLQLYSRVLDYTHRPKNQDTTEVKALVNDAYIYTTSQLRCYQKTSAAITLTANDGDYSIVTDLSITDFSALRVVKYTAANGSSTLNTLAPTTPDEIIALRAANPSAVTPATAYAIQGWDGLMLHPLPSTGDTITIIYTAVPAVMTLDADTPTRIPQEWHHLIVQRAAAVAFETVDDQRAIRHQQQYEHELALAHKWFNQHAGSRGYAPAANNNSGLVLYPGDYFSGIYGN
jgi:hypothetical protein